MEMRGLAGGELVGNGEGGLLLFLVERDGCGLAACRRRSMVTDWKVISAALSVMLPVGSARVTSMVSDAGEGGGLEIGRERERVVLGADGVGQALALSGKSLR